MADFADLGRREAEIHFQQALAKRVNTWGQTEKQSALHCFDCGREIPRARREAIPGVEYCTKCQEARDG